MPTSRTQGTTAGFSAVDPLEFRRTMGEFASGVTVVAAVDGDEPVGFACQSFASVSLDPPLILFCADHRSRTWPRIRHAGRFSVNILGEQQEDLCDRFGSSRGRKFAELDWTTSSWGTPVLTGVLATVHAEVHAVHTAGDHDVVVGHVLALGRHREDRPMVFFRGRFGLETTAEHAVADPWSWIDGWG
ncbi:flavin reductase family protein [Actinomadura rudentiformis]|nr:flavin reductase family protein [Actinomadura rudentiformis]